jgi:anti-sigma factor RsiW
MRNRIADRVTGLLADAEAELVSEHVLRCPSCREYAEALEEEDGLLDGLIAKFGAEMGRREQEAVEAISRFDARSSGGRLWYAKLLVRNAIMKHGAAAAVIVVVGLYFVITFSWVSQITAVIRQGL